ncbi:MAG: hypothetical protein E7333_06420 [Clostridiales bacterium]|nr:hypothetical protein [Clostridiales bacterium]
MNKNCVTLPRILAFLMALVAVAAFFLPYISATEEYSEYIAAHADEKIYSSVDVTVGDLEEMSLFTYAKVYIQGGEEIFRSAAGGYFTGGIYAAVGVFALLTALAALGKKPILTFFMNAIMGIAFYMVNWDVIDRNIMPDSNRVWGLSYHLYYPIIAIIAIVAIWMFVAKRKMKKHA